MPKEVIRSHKQKKEVIRSHKQKKDRNYNGQKEQGQTKIHKTLE